MKKVKKNIVEPFSLPYNVNASLYDIKEYFKGRDSKGRLNKKSPDEHFNQLEKNFNEAMEKLRKKIEPKVYEHGFLRKE